MSSNLCCPAQYGATSNAPLFKSTNSPHVRYMDEYVYASSRNHGGESKKQSSRSAAQLSQFRGFRAHSMRGQAGKAYTDRLRQLPRKNLGFTGMLRRIKYKLSGDSKKISGLVRKTSQAFREKCQDLDLRKYSTASRAPASMSHEGSLYMRQGEEKFPFDADAKYVGMQQSDEYIVPSRSYNPELPDILYEAAPVKVPRHRKSTIQWRRQDARPTKRSSQSSSFHGKLPHTPDRQRFSEEQPAIRTIIVNGRVADMSLGYVRYHDELTESELNQIRPFIEKKHDSNPVISSMEDEHNPWRQRGASDSTSHSRAMPAPPVLRPHHLPSLSMTADQKAWRLSEGSRTTSDNTKRDSRTSSGHYHTHSRTKSEGQCQRTIREVQPPAVSSRLSSNHTFNDNSARSINLIRPETDVMHHAKRSTNGETSHISQSIESKNEDAESASQQSLHLYNMRISQRLASQTSLVSMLGSQEMRNCGPAGPNRSNRGNKMSNGAHHYSMLRDSDPEGKSTSSSRKVSTTAPSSFAIWDDQSNPATTSLATGYLKEDVTRKENAFTEGLDVNNKERATAGKPTARRRGKDRSTDSTISDAALQLLDNLDTKRRQPNQRSSKRSDGGLVTKGDVFSLDGGHDEASLLWERALLAHASRQDSQPGKPKRLGASTDFGNSSKTATLETSNQVKHYPYHRYNEQAGNSQISDRNVSKARQYSESKGEQLQPPRYPSEQSSRPDAANSHSAWSRFPSHTKPERSATAGATDRVMGRDFAARPSCDISGLSPENSEHCTQNQAHKKTRSMTFGKNILKNWGKLYKTRSTDLRRSEAGHRSSIAVGGLLEYPELELLPPSLPTTVENVSSRIQAPSNAIHEESSSFDGHASSTDGSLARPEKVAQARLSAEAWADMYQRHLPRFPRGSSQSSSTSVSSEASYKQKLTQEELNFLSYPPTRSIATEQGSPKTPWQFQQERLDALRNLERQRALKYVEETLNGRR
ncbi:hypothetical protein L228DRAFT_244691 [Xylona heveae TC161]|uniref:Uncharacterized protein n=1 Tax=Xylona heveae (strain CBS 132557 / TC161) TaxID=1328760 RepID=A0A165J5W4_XYLHT|nr:hypothetical protein L228DRAFT_244691 [Xylona heveae TC161]KZF25774.1 hypothetical protein L228DRAFT_244691 [Xylona heveae TC161]